MSTILIVDDEASIREGLKAALDGHHYKILTAEDGEQALQLLQKEKIDLLISDIKMPKMDGMKLQEKALKQDPELLVILLTAYGTVETAVQAMRQGAFDFLTKPVNIDKFEMLVVRALQTKSLQEENQRLKQELHKSNGLQNMIGHSKIMHELFEKIKVVSETKSTVLIYGESGTGKELIASAIHQLSNRKNNPFIPVNCAALSENLLETELFGHEKGAFTGAISRKDGRFRLADKGTLFLDEIGELSLNIQVKLLRFLQEKTFEPVGSSTPIKVDVRFITATNKNLEDLVKQGTFRDDLYYRLNVVKIESPPLRNRKEDIPLLVNHFIRDFSKELEKEVLSISPEALKLLTNYDWPGNVRELKNTIENLVVFTKSKIIQKNQIPDLIANPRKNPGVNSKDSFNVAQNEKYLIQKALEECKFNKTAAAQELGMSRRTIHRKLKEYGIS